MLENMVVRQTIIVSKSKIYSEIFCMSSQIGTSISRIPGSLRKFVKLWHDHGFKYSIATQINKLRYKSLNKGLTESQLAVSQGITLNVHQEANSSFRYFTDFDADTFQAFIQAFPQMKMIHLMKTHDKQNHEIGWLNVVLQKVS